MLALREELLFSPSDMTWSGAEGRREGTSQTILVAGVGGGGWTWSWEVKLCPPEWLRACSLGRPSAISSEPEALGHGQGGTQESNDLSSGAQRMPLPLTQALTWGSCPGSSQLCFHHSFPNNAYPCLPGMWAALRSTPRPPMPIRIQPGLFHSWHEGQRQGRGKRCLMADEGVSEKKLTLAGAVPCHRL